MNGLRVLNTRPLHQSKALDQAIRDAGGVSINLPALTITATEAVATSSPVVVPAKAGIHPEAKTDVQSGMDSRLRGKDNLVQGWLSDMPDLSTVNQAIFISANAVEYYFSALKQTHITWPETINVIAVGKATAAALSRQEIQVHHIPSMADSEHLLKLDALQVIQHQTILLIKGLDGRPLIADTLQSRGACLIPLPVYRRDLPVINQEYINSIWQDDAVDIILFTSQQAMHNILTMFGDEGLPWLRGKPCVVISERLAKAAAEAGIRNIITCRYDELLETLGTFVT